VTTRQVLVGVDGSAESEAAADWAAREARRRGAVLRIVHVWPWLTEQEPDTGRPDNPRPTAMRALGETADRLRRDHLGLVVETEVISDDPADGLVRAAEGRELLVLGSRGIGGFAGLLVGSVGLAVAARSAVPVVLVRPGGPAPEGADREVVVGLDARHPADAVLDFAFTEAALRGARLRAVHCWESVPAWSYGGWAPVQVDVVEQRAAEAALVTAALAARREKHPEVEVVETVRLGGAAWALVDASDEAELVVVGRRERRHEIGLRLGPVAHGVIHHAKAPVAVVPHP